MLELEEQQAWAKFRASVLLSTLNFLASALYLPHSRTCLASLFHRGLMLNSLAPGIM